MDFLVIGYNLILDVLSLMLVIRLQKDHIPRKTHSQRRGPVKRCHLRACGAECHSTTKYLITKQPHYISFVLSLQTHFGGYDNNE